MKYLLLTVMCLGLSFAGFADKVYTPSTAGSLVGGSTYCQNATASVLTFTYNTCNAGVGTSAGTALTITWYSNSINSTTGGSVESVTFVSSALTATGTTSFLPSTTNTGTTYYYCVITWSGSGTCNTSGTLTSSVASVVVNASPDVITGTLSTCVGTQSSLSNTVGGGTWTSSMTAKATITSGGIVTGVSAGTSVITYAIGTCRSTATFTVNANPLAITGTNTVCEGLTTSFTDATAGGTWSIDAPSTATINASSPVTITGLSAGAANVTYTLNTTGCYVTRPLTVNTTPAAITGTPAACIGFSSTLSSTPSSGVWSSSVPTRATITTGGVVTALTAGTSVISYTLGSCRSTATFTVNANPAAITGTNTVCEGATTSFTDATASGTWSIDAPSTATINASSPVTITGLSAGAANVTYTLGGTGCYATRPLTVNTTPAAITGTLVACTGFSSTLASTTPSGVWSSSVPAKATITTGGVVTGLTAGTSVISYTLGSCRSTATFTVNASPAAITGTNTVCEGLVTTFTDATTGGTWTTDAPAIASVNASNPVGITGVDAGTANITYTLSSTGCFASRAVTVNTTPDAITGILSACIGTTSTLASTTPSGTWTSSVPTRVTIDAGGVATALSAGTSVISYTLGACRTTATFTANANPVAITGTNTVCEGSITTFTDATAGGTWSTDAPATASVNTSSPVGITGVSAGTANIIYTLNATGCFATRAVTVNTTPAAITGILSACMGTVSTLSSTTPSGTWSSATPAKATIDANGVVTPVAAGTSVISYTLGSCRATATFTANANPVAITGTNTVCVGLVTTFTDATTGGTWSSLDPSTASVNGSNPVGITGVAAGSTNISYTLSTGCYAVRAVTVNASPAAITGTSSSCAGVQTTLSDVTIGGTWASGTVAKATITSGGVVTAVAAGTSLISYTVGSCRSTFLFTVNPTPTAITGANTLCTGTVTTFANTVAGGTWATSNPSVATIDASSPVNITGTGVGSAIISYAIGTCAVGKTITVSASPAAITGNTSACVGIITTLADATTGGTWTSGNTARATITSGGVVSPFSAGTSLISYTVGSCRSTLLFTINSTPGSIAGNNTVCNGSVTTFSNITAGGVWTTSDPSKATVDASSPVNITGVGVGSATISYTIGSCAVGRSITINAQPDVITGTPSACIGNSSTLSNTTIGGTWMSTTPGVATINTSGRVTALTSGTSLISYTLGACRSTVTFSSNDYPSAIIGTNTVCEGSVTTFDDVTAGGTWSSNAPSTATVDGSTPVNITGVTAGTTTISYTLPTGCGVGRGITVNTTPVAITGTLNACIGNSSTLSNTTLGGVWSSATPSVATITSGGVVTALSAGTSVITYTLGSCYNTATFTVNPNPAAITAGASTICEGAATTFSDATAGGTWSTGTPSVATIDGSSPVNINGLVAGTSVIAYTLSTGCYASSLLTVSAQPTAIIGTTTECIGFSSTLSNAVTGGTWATSDAGIVTINAISGMATGVAGGTATITYTRSVCSVTTLFTTKTPPASIVGASSTCAGTSTTFTNSVSGGTWSSANGSVATVDATTGMVYGVAGGTTNISYSTGCDPVSVQSITITTVPAMPSAITGTTTFCAGTISTLADVTPSGVWSSTNTAAATIDAFGVVTGVAGGSSTISYTVTNVCGSTAQTQAITVVDYPTAAITTADNTCINYASTIVFTGSTGATITYNVDGGSNSSAILTGGTFSLSTGIVTSSHTYELVEVHNATCQTTKDTFATIAPITMTWMGGTFGHESEWERASNWSCGFVPGDTTNVVIPSGTTYSPEVSTTRTVSVKNLTVASGAKITGTGTAILRVKGTLSNNGTFDGAGSLIINGSSAQTISGVGRVSNLTLANSSGATISTGSKLTIVKMLTISSGTLTTNDSLNLASDSVATAYVAAIPFGSSISGNVKVNQYIRPNYRRYRFWSHPFASTISLSQVENYIDITGAGGSTNGFTSTMSNNPSCFRYNPLFANSALGSDPVWVAFNKINSSAVDSNTFHQYQGIRLFIRGTKGQGLSYTTDPVSPVTIGMFGALNQGDQTVTLTKGTGSNRDYNMVGNPYAAPVDLGTVAYNAKAANKVAGSAFYVWDPYLGAGGQYITVNIGTSAASPYYMQPYTCFQIRAMNNGDAMTFAESNKGTMSDTPLLKAQPESVSLTIYDANYHPWDMLHIKFNNSATSEEDNDYDARKLKGSDLNFYSISADGQDLAIDGRPFNTEEIIPLGLTTNYNQDYIIRAESVVVPDGGSLYLHDKLLNKYTALDAGVEYRFTVDKNVASQGDQRFELKETKGTLVNSGLQVALAPNPATDEINISFNAEKSDNVTVRIVDINGVSVYNKNVGAMQSGNVKVVLKDLSAGIYMVELTSGNQKSVHKLIKE